MAEEVAEQLDREDDVRPGWPPPDDVVTAKVAEILTQEPSAPEAPEEPEATAEAPAEPEPSPEERIAALEAELETTRKRQQDTRTDWNRLQAENRKEQIQMQLLEAAHQQLLEQQQRAAESPPPSPKDWDEVLSDGNKLGEYLQQRDQWVQQRILSQLAPGLQQTAMLSQVILPAMAERAGDSAWQDAKRLAEAEGFADFDSYKAAVDQAFTVRGDRPDIYVGRFNPETVLTVARYLRDEATHRKPVKNKPAAPQGAGPSRKAQTAAPAEVPDYIRRYSERFGVDPAKVAANWKKHQESRAKRGVF